MQPRSTERTSNRKPLGQHTLLMQSRRGGFIEIDVFSRPRTIAENNPRGAAFQGKVLSILNLHLSAFQEITLNAKLLTSPHPELTFSEPSLSKTQTALTKNKSF